MVPETRPLVPLGLPCKNPTHGTLKCRCSRCSRCDATLFFFSRAHAISGRWPESSSVLHQRPSLANWLAHVYASLRREYSTASRTRAPELLSLFPVPRPVRITCPLNTSYAFTEAEDALTLAPSSGFSQTLGCGYQGILRKSRVDTGVVWLSG